MAPPTFRKQIPRLLRDREVDSMVNHFINKLNEVFYLQLLLGSLILQEHNTSCEDSEMKSFLIKFIKYGEAELRQSFHCFHQY